MSEKVCSICQKSFASSAASLLLASSRPLRIRFSSAIAGSQLETFEVSLYHFSKNNLCKMSPEIFLWNENLLRLKVSFQATGHDSQSTKANAKKSPTFSEKLKYHVCDMLKLCWIQAALCGLVSSSGSSTIFVPQWICNHLEIDISSFHWKPVVFWLPSCKLT